MSSILKMSFRFSLIFSCCSLLMTPSIATPFASNDSASRAMGGTGTASAETYASSYFNPSLLAADADDKGIGFMLPSATVTFDDSSRLLQASRDYFEESYDIFSNYDVATISTLISGEGDASIIGSFDAVAAASAAVAAKLAEPRGAQDSVNIDTEIAGLISANDNLQSNMSLMKDEIDNARDVVANASAGLGDLSDRPVQVSAGVAIAAAIPSKKWGTSLFLHNDLLTGVKVDIDQQDTDILVNVIDDFKDMVDIAADVSIELTKVVEETAVLSALMVAPPEEAGWTDDQWADAALAEAGGGDDLTVAQNNLTTYLTSLAEQAEDVNDQVVTAQTESERLDTYEGNYVSGGELTLTEDNRPTLVSSVSIVGANIAEMGISLARQFEIGGEKVNIGITPKFQRLDMFDHVYVAEALIDGSEIEAFQQDTVAYIKEHYTSKNTMNLDIGASKDFTYKGNIRIGLVVKNLIAQTFTTEGGTKITIPTQIRAAVAHSTKITTLALDVDITENQPLTFGEPTQYIAIGGEFNLFNHAKFRAGYRNNIAVQNGATFSLGLAFTPFGIGADVAAWIKPTDDVFEAVQDTGLSVQLSAQF